MMSARRVLAKTVSGLYEGVAVVKHRLRFRGADGTQVFADIFRRNSWRGAESRSGSGSNLAQTQQIRAALPDLLTQLDVRSLLDVPCGDHHWMSQVELPLDCYIGADIVAPLIDQNTARFADRQRTFVVRDITRDALPTADLILCRDCLVHLSFADIERAVQNINRSGARFLLTTTFISRDANHDAATGRWRPLDLEKPPFNFPPPERVIVEGCTENNGAYADKALALWALPL
jgi:hypothetical protein